MQLSPVAIEHLRDEAYAFLCREAVQKKLDSLEREKAAISSTRPPFGVLARKELGEIIAQSMRTVCDTETSLRDRLAQIAQVEEWLRPAIRGEVIAHLAATSPDYQRYAEIRGFLKSWEELFASLADLLTTLVRDARGVRKEIATGRRSKETFAPLRDVVMRVNLQLTALTDISVALGLITAAHTDLAREIRLPVPPEFRPESWVGRLAVMPADVAMTDLSRVENEIRGFLSGDYSRALARLEASRFACGMFEERCCQYLWDQLRVHARVHYVEARDIDDVLAMLSQRYVKYQIDRADAGVTRSPFLTGR